MRSAGFTLLELLVVVVIIGILTTIAVPQYRRSVDRSKAAEAMQMLPALFDARERWVEEFQCQWRTDNGQIFNCDGAETLSAAKLDFEVKGTPEGQTITTKNFIYNLQDTQIGKRASVSAKPTWGSSRKLTSATIYYDGRKFSCREDSSAGSEHPCDALNVDIAGS